MSWNYDRIRSGYRTYVVVAVPLGILLVVGGVASHSGKATVTGLGLFAGVVLPWILIAAAVLLLLGLGAGAVLLFSGRDHARKWRLRKRLEELDSLRGAPQEEVRRVLAAIGELEPHFSPGIGSRMLREDYAFRRELLDWTAPDTLEEVANRPQDPLAPACWLKALRIRHTPYSRSDEPHPVREDVTEEKVREHWIRAMASGDPYVLPAELMIPAPGQGLPGRS